MNKSTRIEVENIDQAKELLKSTQKEDLEKGRLIIREGISRITDEIVNLFLMRQELMGYIAESKKNNEPILQLSRELDLLYRYQFENDDLSELEKEFLQMIIWLIMSAGKEKQRTILGRDSVFVKEDIPLEQLNLNLLALTEKVANNYEDYSKGFPGLEITQSIEKREIDAVLDNIADKNKDVAVDLGCATGGMTNHIKQHGGFNKVIGLDISQSMVDVAKLKDTAEVSYICTDTFTKLPFDDNSIDFINANFGSASEVCEDILGEVSRVLKESGKAYLSFYNENHISNQRWQPWQNSSKAVINKMSNIVEVPFITDKERSAFKLYAKATSYEKIQEQATSLNMKVESVSSFPTVLSTMPPMFFHDHGRVDTMIKFEEFHKSTYPYGGVYINVLLSK